jgi:hypothetical protein
LDPQFKSWLDHFASWCRSANVEADNNDALIDALRRYSNHLGETPLQDRNFLRAEVFDLFRTHCEVGDERAMSLMRSIAALKPR